MFIWGDPVWQGDQTTATTDQVAVLIGCCPSHCPSTLSFPSLSHSLDLVWATSFLAELQLLPSPIPQRAAQVFLKVPPAHTHWILNPKL